MAREGHLLIIDDNVERAAPLVDLLVEQGYAIDLISDLASADISLSMATDLDLVICEVNLDGVSWDDAREQLRDVDIQVPSIMLSDDGDTEMMMMALRLGASDYFVRPLDDPDALFRSIDRCVKLRQMRRELEASRAQLEATNTELRGTVKVLEQDQQAGRQVQMRMLPSEPLVIEDYVFSHCLLYTSDAADE